MGIWHRLSKLIMDIGCFLETTLSEGYQENAYVT